MRVYLWVDGWVGVGVGVGGGVDVSVGVGWVYVWECICVYRGDMHIDTHKHAHTPTHILGGKDEGKDQNLHIYTHKHTHTHTHIGRARMGARIKMGICGGYD